MVTNITALADDLEKQELDQAPKGTPSFQVYAQLLAVYLYQNDLCNAKFLWNRIPASVKSSNPVLGHIWAVGQHMWKRDYAGIYTALGATTWPEPISEIMTALQETIRNRAVNLIAQAYSSISLDGVITMTGLTADQVATGCAEKGWQIEKENKIILPCKPTITSSGETSSEDQLYKLTEFVSFLEN